jgi:hypothetical protein
MANGLLDLLGGLGTKPPAYLEGLLGAQQTEDLRKQSIGTGLANALVGYLAMPKNQNLGLGRILANTAQAGMQGAQGVYSSAVEDYQTKAKIDEMNRNKAIAERDLRRQTEMEALAPQLIKTTPAQYQEVQGNPYFIPAATAPDATSPNYNLQSVMPEPTRQLVSPEQRTIDMGVLQQIVGRSKDPLAALKVGADLVPSLKKAGFLQSGQQDNPFDMFIESESPVVQKLAKKYKQSYANSMLDEDKENKALTTLATMEDRYAGRTDAASARQAENDRQFELRTLLANNQISQQDFQHQMAQSQLALQQQLAANKNVKVLPPKALTDEGADITSAYETLQLANDVDSQIKSVIANKVNFNPANNAKLAVQSSLGSTSPEVLTYNELQRFNTKYVNDSLKLAKGTQTEGDAVRAAKELSNAKSTQDLILALQKMRDLNIKNIETKNKIILSRRNSGGLTEDRGYSAPEQIQVPKFEPVIYGDSMTYKQLPAGSFYLDGNTGVRKVKGGK